MQCGVIDGRGERCGKGALDEAEAAALGRTLEMRLTASVARGVRESPAGLPRGWSLLLERN